MIDFSKYRKNTLLVTRKNGLYKYELPGYKFSKWVAFENIPLEIQERVGILLTAPIKTEIEGVGEHTYPHGTFLLYDQ